MAVIATRVTDRSVWLVAKTFKGGTKYFAFSDNDCPIWTKDLTVAYQHHSADSAANRLQSYSRLSFKKAFVAKMDIKTTFNVSVDYERLQGV
jgi:hypothetical protein